MERLEAREDEAMERLKAGENEGCGCGEPSAGDRGTTVNEVEGGTFICQ